MTDKEKFDAFIASYENYRAALEAIEKLSSNDPSDRISARDYAVAYAQANQPGVQGAIDQIARADLQNKSQALDMLFEEARDNTLRRAHNKFIADSNIIIKETPDKGLAAIVLDEVMPIPIDRDNNHNKIVVVHTNYQKLGALMPRKGADGQMIMPEHGALYRALEGFVKERVESKYANDEDFRNDPKVNKYKEHTEAVSKFLLASSARLCLNGVISLRKSYEADFNRYLPDESDKAAYARKSLNELVAMSNKEYKDRQIKLGKDKLIEIGMRTVFRANDVAKDEEEDED